MDIEGSLLRIPVLKGYYLKKVSRLKRQFCLLLERFGLLKPFTFVQWLATYNCNLRCPYCEASAGKPSENELTTEEVKGLVDDLSDMGVKRFLISGGEPLLRSDLMEIMKYANRHHLELGLVTNGFFVEDRWNELRQFKYFLYFTSIDGTPEYGNRMRGNREAFQRAMKGLELFGRLSIPAIMVNTVVHPGNIDQLESLFKILKNSSATYWRLAPIARVGRAATRNEYTLTGKQLRFLADFINTHQKGMRIEFCESHGYLACFDGRSLGKPFFCGAGLTRCSVMPDGEVIGCHQVYDVSLSEGNIRDKRFSQIWKEGFTRFRRDEFALPCRTCAYLDQCNGGCWAEMVKQGSCLKSVWEDND
ncbi:MAG: radical SAM protein [Thermodesulfobacteriota bacterium]